MQLRDVINGGDTVLHSQIVAEKKKKGKVLPHLCIFTRTEAAEAGTDRAMRFMRNPRGGQLLRVVSVPAAPRRRPCVGSVAVATCPAVGCSSVAPCAAAAAHPI